MDNLNDFAHFSIIVEHGGFSAASRATGIPKSRLSRRLAALETSLNIRLLERSSRRFMLTDAGKQVYRHALAMAREAGAARNLVADLQSIPSGLIRIACPPGMLACGISAILLHYLREHPGVSIEITTTNRQIDLISEGIDIALRARALPLEPSEMIMKKLGEATQCLVASNELAGSNPITRLEELSSLPSVSHKTSVNDHIWRFIGSNGEQRTIRHRPRLAVEDFTMLVQAVRKGIGIAAIPYFAIADELNSGVMVELLPEFPLVNDLVHAVFPSRKGMRPAIRQLLDFMAADQELFKRLQQRSVP